MDWCVERAMQYASAGDMSNAWASFIQDVKLHPGTEYIASHELLALTMFGGFEDTPDKFKRFITGWAVKS